MTDIFHGALNTGGAGITSRSWPSPNTTPAITRLLSPAVDRDRTRYIPIALPPSRPIERDQGRAKELRKHLGISNRASVVLDVGSPCLISHSNERARSILQQTNLGDLHQELAAAPVTHVYFVKRNSYLHPDSFLDYPYGFELP